jgi:hypothetical protein
MALRIYAAHGEDVARAEIGEDGAVRLGMDGHLLGFVNADGSAGNAYVLYCIFHSFRSCSVFAKIERI